MKYTSPIDPHVHLRWNEYAAHGLFAQEAFNQARAVGLCCMIEMPNTTPTLTSAERITHRVSDLSKDSKGLAHLIHVGATTSVEQLIDAFRMAESMQKLVGGVKVYFTHSTGEMGILDKWWQRLIWQIAAEVEYKGVILGHFEDEKRYGLPSGREWRDISNAFQDLSSVPFAKCDRFYPTTPVSHSLFQHEEAELEQVKTQISFADQCGFKGTFYICHVSSPLTVEYVESRREQGLSFNIVLEVTWHHLFMNVDSYKKFGNHAKMNPPLRRSLAQKQLLEMAIDGRIDLIGSDHAPHTPEKKIGKSPASGIRAIPFWPRGIELLRYCGIDEGLLRLMTFDKANELFNLGLGTKEVEVEYDKSFWLPDDPLSNV